MIPAFCVKFGHHHTLKGEERWDDEERKDKRWSRRRAPAV